MSRQRILFDQRFLERHVGAIIVDPAVAVVELVANSWDAYATQVSITWPQQNSRKPFSITDNGKGMTSPQFERRWGTIDYNRVAEEGSYSEPPEEISDFPSRPTYGRNGRGRHAAFLFSNPYKVRTWREGIEIIYEVRRGTNQPFAWKLIQSRKSAQGHGTEICAMAHNPLLMTAEEARQIIGSRFLADPNFTVSINGTPVTFDDVPQGRIREKDIHVPTYGTAHLVMIDTFKADRTTRQHGIAWRVKSRLVGNCGWLDYDHERILDGRTAEAKRFTFIVSVDFLEDAVLPDWSGFDPHSKAWHAARAAVHEIIREYLSTITADRRRQTKQVVKQNLGLKVNRLAPVGRDRWNQFVDRVVDSCPSITPDEVQQVAEILANLEISTSKYGLVSKLRDLPPGDLDELHSILDDWTVRTAKLALDEIQTRLELVSELDEKLRDESADEVSDLQPLFERSLWVFGPEFESLEFTSNRGMTEVIRKLFGIRQQAGRLRPDFVMLPDGSVGFYSRDSHDLGHEVDGVSRLVIAEIKRPGIVIGTEQKGQAWTYVRKLIDEGLLTEAAHVTCFVLGSKVDQTEASDRTEWNGRVLIRPMAYDVFVRRAEKRMLGLREKLAQAPFLQERVPGAADSAVPSSYQQTELALDVRERAAD